MRKWLGIWFGVFLTAQTGFGFGYAALARVIRDHHVRSIDELLPLLPPHYRKYYTLVYQSRSLQAGEVSPASPRIILYGEDSKLILAFTEHGDALEIIEFNEAKSAFHFRTLSFSLGKDPLIPEPEINPALCKHCHGADPRPNWDAYNIWPGVYGSVSRNNCDTMQEGTTELKNYLSFLAGNRKIGRYRFLAPEYTGPTRCPQPPHGDYTFKNGAVTNPNARFTDQLFDLNARRIRRLIVESPSYPRFKYLWAGLAKDCLGDAEKFFPLNYYQTHHLPDFETTKKELFDLGVLEFTQRSKALHLHNAGSQYEPARVPVNFLNDGYGGQYSQLEATARLKLVADRSRVSSHRWETGFSDGHWAFATPLKGPEAMFRHWSLPGVGPFTCDELATQSVLALSTP